MRAVVFDLDAADRHHDVGVAIVDQRIGFQQHSGGGIGGNAERLGIGLRGGHADNKAAQRDRRKRNGTQPRYRAAVLCRRDAHYPSSLNSKNATPINIATATGSHAATTGGTRPALPNAVTDTVTT